MKRRSRLLCLTVLMIVFFILIACEQSPEIMETKAVPTNNGVLPSPSPLSNFITNAPNKSTPTKDLITTNPLMQQMPSGLLYLWMARFEEPLYTRIDLSHDLPINLDIRLSPKEIVSDNLITISLAFAPYSTKIAYVTKSPVSTDLWIADLDFSKVEHVGTIDQEWLGQGEIPPDIRIKWGPLDSSLLLSSDLAKDHLVIYSVTTGKIENVIGECDQVALDPSSSGLAIWCSLRSESRTTYAYFTMKGGLEYTNSNPELGTGIIDWSIAPDHNQLAYIPSDGAEVIIRKQEDTIKLPIQFQSNSGIEVIHNYLHWSDHGDKLLIYGFNQENCQLVENPITGDLEASACWQVINSISGEIIWYPKMSADLIREATGFSLEQLQSSCAYLSPSGDWLSLCYQNGAMEGLLLIGINSQGKIIDIVGSGPILDLRWLNE